MGAELADELSRFKREVDLTELAGSMGYEIDRQKSGARNVVMRNASGDKVVISRQGDGHWVYFGVRDSKDQGTVIDFLQRRTGDSLGHIRIRLREWLRLPARVSQSGHVRSNLRPETHGDLSDLVHPDTSRQAIRRNYDGMVCVADGRHDFLNGVRDLPAELLASPRFAGTFRADSQGRAVFPHYGDIVPNDESVCGIEVKGTEHARFVTGSRKGLWLSQQFDGDDRLIITESVIDAMSYALLFGHERSRFAATSGSIGQFQESLLERLAKSMPPSSMIVLALDNDESGRRSAECIRKLFSLMPTSDHFPEGEFKDWNDVARSRQM